MWNVDGLQPDEMTNLGSIRLKEIDEGFEKALQDFDKAIELHPGYASTYFWLGRSHRGVPGVVRPNSKKPSKISTKAT